MGIFSQVQQTKQPTFRVGRILRVLRGRHLGCKHHAIETALEAGREDAGLGLPSPEPWQVTGPFPTSRLNMAKDKNLDSVCFTFGALKS